MTKSDTREALKDFVKGILKDPCLTCIVKSVDENKRTITVYSERDKVEYFDVRLMALADEEAGKGILVLPKVGSEVIIGMIDGVDTMYFVAGYSEVDSVEFTIGNMKLKMDSSGFVFNDGTNQGVVNVIALTAKLNTLESAYNGLVAAFNAFVAAYVSHFHVPGGPPPLVPAVPYTVVVPVTSKNQIEDTKVKH